MGNEISTGVEQFVEMTSETTGIVKTKICINETIEKTEELYGLYPNTNLTFIETESNDYGLFGKFNTNNLVIDKDYKIISDTPGLILPDTAWVMIKSHEKTEMITFNKTGLMFEKLFKDMSNVNPVVSHNDTNEEEPNISRDS